MKKMQINCLCYMVMIFLSITTVSSSTTSPASSSESPSSSNESLSESPSSTNEPDDNSTSPETIPFSQVNVVTLAPMQKEVAGVRMYFREGPSLSSAPVFNVYLGDRFYMFLEYTGEEYVIKPVECTAYSGVVLDESVTNVVLWNQRSGRKEVMENFINETSTRLQATLYGFHFNSSPYVTIECTVRICRKDTKCATAPICGTSRRRRKKDLSSLGSSSFRVLDGVKNNGGLIRSSPFHSYTACWILLLTAFIKDFIVL